MSTPALALPLREIVPGSAEEPLRSERPGLAKHRSVPSKRPQRVLSALGKLYCVCKLALVKNLDQFSDLRHRGWCIHCGTAKGSCSFTRDHVPSKSLLDRPFPEELPVLDICGPCNNKFSADEEYLKILLACVFEGTCEPAELQDEKVGRALARNATLLADIRQARSEIEALDGKREIIWKPDYERLAPPLLKNAKGHYFYEMGEPIEGDPMQMGIAPLQTLDSKIRSNFEAASIGPGWPEVGSRMMNRLLSGVDMEGGWVVVQPDVYRFAIHEHRAVRIVIREYLAFEAVWE